MIQDVGERVSLLTVKKRLPEQNFKEFTIDAKRVMEHSFTLFPT